MKPFSVKVLSIAALLSLACTTKVSEWVLLNAVPNEYTLVYFHKNAVTETAKAGNDMLHKRFMGSNIKFRDVVKEDAIQPYYGLYYGNRLFSRYDNPEQMTGLASSPMRQKMAGELMKGKLCLMLYLRSGDKVKDDKRIEEIRKAVAASPFKEIIPVFELDRNDVAEKHLVTMLLNVESDLKDIREPMLFGVFGRLKALEPLVAGGITQENINFMIDFLTADCSCLIKDDLPGTDMLYAGSWESPSTALVNAIIDANPSLSHR